MSSEHSTSPFEDNIEEEAVTSRWIAAGSSGQVMTPDNVARILADVKYEHALRLPDDDAEKSSRLMRAGHVYFALHHLSNDNADLNQTIVSYDAAVRVTPDGHQLQAELYRLLGGALLKRIKYRAGIADIENAIFAFDSSLILTPEGHASNTGSLYQLSISLTHRYEQSGDLVDIDKAIAAQERAMLGHADRPDYFNHLGNSFLRRFGRSGDLVDINKAISAHEQADRLTPDDHPNKPNYLTNLGVSFMRLFGCSGNLAHLDKAMVVQEQAVSITPDGLAADKSNCLNNLGNSFLSRFLHSRALVDIDKAIAAHERALHLTPDGHADIRFCLGNLGTSFSHRFECSRDIVDIDEAIRAHERAVHLTPDGHTDMPLCLSNLGNSLSRRFERSKNLVDIDKAISAHERAAHLTPDGHADMPRCLTNLGISFWHRFRRSRNQDDIDKAIDAHERAVHLISDSHAAKSGYPNNLGNSMSQRFMHSGDLVDIDMAINAHERATHLTPDGHADMPNHLRNLGIDLSNRFKLFGDRADNIASISHFRRAATYPSGSSLIRLHSALQWGRLASEAATSCALQGYAVALDLLPQVAWLGQTIQARHRELISLSHVPSEAAAVAIAAGEYDIALEWLEQGRSIVWNQLLNLRTPVDALHNVNACLANDLMRVSKALEHAGSRNMDMQSLSAQSDSSLSMEEVAQGHRRLAEEWELLVQTARNIPGFEDFLQAKKLVQLRLAAAAGPVVVINIHKHRSDALVLMNDSEEVIHIPLDHFSYEKAQDLHHSLNRLLSAAGVRARYVRAMRRVKPTADAVNFPTILSELWLCVVKPVLDGLAITAPYTTDPRRIWWCPTGPLAFLPIHAAGVYDNSAAAANISDYVISSYAPTLNALINATEYHQTSREFRGLLAVSQPNTPGQSTLPNTTVELAKIQQQARDFLVYTLEGVEALVERVINGMEACSWVHLACHGLQDMAEPTRSALCLHDGHLELFTLITKSFSNADFAFLSACQTATGDEKLSEEAVHLAAGLMLAGYCSIIATMWSIKDKDAPVIADNVYSELFSDAEPDSTKAALALHNAVKLLRRQAGDSAFLSWVPFIHMGI